MYLKYTKFLKSIPLTFLFSFLFLLPSCEEPGFVGLEIQPEEDRFKVKSSQDPFIGSSLWPRDSLRAAGFPRSLLGVVNDPVFGRLGASFLTQLGIATQADFGEGRATDSLVLYLYYTHQYGDIQDIQNIRVYEVDQIIDPEIPYFSNLDPQTMIFDQEIASHAISQQPGDTIISIPITSQEFQEKLLFAPDSVMLSIGAFITYMKGLYVTADLADETGGLFRVNLNDANSRMTLYYHNVEHSDTTLAFHYIINADANRLNLYDHDYLQAVFHEKISQPGILDSVFYVQGAAGVMGRLDFTGLHEWRDSVPVSINSARLILPVESADATSALFPLPARLSLSERSLEGELFSLTDMALGDQYFDGTYNDEAGEYRFNITHWMQSFILDENKSNSLYVATRDGGLNPERAVLKSMHHPAGGPRLEITYTRH